MKIAEALMKRSAMTTNLSELRERMVKNVKVQEGDVPQEDVNALKEIYLKISEELTALVCKINKTNQVITNKDGVSLADLLAERDRYKMLVKANKDLYDNAMIVSRFGRSEVRLICTIDVKALQVEISEYSKKYREIDTEIQGLNWTKDLVE